MKRKVILLFLPLVFQDWIYRQVCSSGCPLHSLLPSLIEVYVNSIIIKSTKTDHLNEPMTDQEVLDVYKSSVFCRDRGDNSSMYNLTPQLIVLYYLLLYEDTVLNNMKIIGMYNVVIGEITLVDYFVIRLVNSVWHHFQQYFSYNAEKTMTNIIT